MAKTSTYLISAALFQTNALTIDVIYSGGGGAAGQAQDSTVAAVDMFDGVSTQRDIHVKAEQHSDTQHSNDPGQAAADVQPRRGHDGRIPERFTHSNVPAETVREKKSKTSSTVFT